MGLRFFFNNSTPTKTPHLFKKTALFTETLKAFIFHAFSSEFFTAFSILFFADGFDKRAILKIVSYNWAQHFYAIFKCTLSSNTDTTKKEERDFIETKWDIKKGK